MTKEKVEVVQEAEKALSGMIAAWDALEGGTRHSPEVIQRWLIDHMKPAVDQCVIGLAEIHAQALSRQQQEGGEEGWIVSSGDGKRFRTWEQGMPEWTDNRDEATRYARRQDAEAVHQEDEDAWGVTPYNLTVHPSRSDDAGMVAKGNCSCAEVYGEDPRCIKHGRGTEWAKRNPDICMAVEKAGAFEMISEALGFPRGHCLVCGESEGACVHFPIDQARHVVAALRQPTPVVSAESQIDNTSGGCVRCGDMTPVVGDVGRRTWLSYERPVDARMSGMPSDQELAALPSSADARVRLPRLTRRLIAAAAAGHYGKANVDRFGITGIDLTYDGENFTFEQGFRRMWKGLIAALSAEGEGVGK